MTAARLSLVFLVLLPSLSGAADLPATPLPQPRVRLHRTPEGSIARVEPVATPAATASVLLAPLVVRDARIPSTPQPLLEEARSRFSPARGGPMKRKSFGRVLVEFGLWPHTDFFAADAGYKPAATRVEFQIARVKW